MALTQIGSDGLKDQAVTDPKIKDNLDYTSALEANTISASQITSTGAAIGGGTTNAAILDDDGVTLSATSSGPCELRFSGTSGGDYVAFKSDGSFSGTTTFVLPDGDGSANQVLKTDGSGNLDWTSTTDTNTQLSNAEVRTAVEAASDSNVFTDADHTKLDGIAAGATVGAALTGSTNNTITTVTGANAIQGEAKLTFDGDTLKFTHDAVTNFDSNSQDFLVIENGDSDTYINIGTETNRDSGILFSDDTRAKGWFNYNHGSDYVYIGTAGSERLRITSAGKVGLNEDTPVGDLHITTAGSSQEDGVLYVGGSNSTLGLQLSYDQSGNTSAKITTNSNYSNASSKLSICVDENANDDQLVLTGDGNVEIGDGNLKIGTAGHGIDFSAFATSGNPNSNLLDDYEEGSFDANFKFGGGAANISHAQYEGKYTKIGRLVTCSFVIGLSSKGTSTGNASINALPFTSTNDSGDRMGGYVTFYGGMSNIDSQISLYNTTNTTLVYLYDSNPTVNAVLTNSNFTDGTHMRGVIQYHCA